MVEGRATTPIRELFVEELAEVTGGSGPIEELLDRLFSTTQACCEEGNCGCDGPT